MPMVNPKSKVAGRPKIGFRSILPSDLDTIEHLHEKLFPIRYESLFFQDVVNGHDIVSWGAVDHSRPEGQSDELIGFVTARIVLGKEIETGDIPGCDSSKSDQTLIYILTLGVVEAYRNLGIASSLIREVIKYASSIPTCLAVYLHVISYNNPAIFLYKKMSFKYVRTLRGFYLINGQHYDSYLFVYYVNGRCSPCSPLVFLTGIVSCMRSGFKSITSRLCRNEERKISRWVKCKENHSLVSSTHNKKSMAIECTRYECV
ncbi:histone acetyltransferase MCC1 [Prosopis cineraria]|uniref:histone acetyltransferase MCC1 n=1 Tax=Prosopis cineraria TaxID=364024 RepID=UPI002410650E|nr:histone acetyltransferase MCC1 [Prosopis cineraria]XP_054810876.1 histone acetyltransferase MCC1 [Prosopis cineraria]XP_054810877.1 histone acetyltransferase MCC1 [Prosopis cineraria]